MNENELKQWIQNMDHDLIVNEIDDLLGDVTVDMEAIANKARAKLKQETLQTQTKTKTHKRKLKNTLRLPLIAALMILVIGGSAVFAQQITTFIQSLLGKVQIYDTIVEGDSFYLETPIQLEDWLQLTSVLYTKDRVQLVIMPSTRIEKWNSLGLFITDQGKQYDITGGALYDNNQMILSFVDPDGNAPFHPTNKLNFTILGKSYDIGLVEGTPVLNQGDVIEGGTTVEGVTFGCQISGDDILLLPQFEDKNMKLLSVGPPLEPVAKTITDFINGKGSGNPTLTKPFNALDETGNAIALLSRDENATSFPVLLFHPDKPLPPSAQLQIPSIFIRYEKEIEVPSMQLTLPTIGQEISVQHEFAFALQKMMLETVTRPASDKVQLVFALNTGERKDIGIRDVFAYGTNVKTIETIWENNQCTMLFTIDETVTDMELSISAPNYSINGSWLIPLK